MSDCEFPKYNVSRELYNALYNPETLKERMEKKVHIFPPQKHSSLSCCCGEQYWIAWWWTSDSRYWDSGLAKVRICPKCFTVWSYTGAGNVIVRANESTPKEALEQYTTHDEAHGPCDALDELGELVYTLLVDVFARAEKTGDS